MGVVERRLYCLIKARIGKEPIKVRLANTMKNSGVHISRLVVTSYATGRTPMGLQLSFSAAPPLELLKMMISMMETTHWDVVMHKDISHAYFHAPSTEENHAGVPHEMWTSGGLDRGRERERVVAVRHASCCSELE